jgi:hypothetical protein
MLTPSFTRIPLGFNFYDWTELGKKEFYSFEDTSGLPGRIKWTTVMSFCHPITQETLNNFKCDITNVTGQDVFTILINQSTG